MNFPWLLLGTWAHCILPCIHAECPPGDWKESQGSCYLFVLEPQTQAAAQTACTKQGGHLTSVADDEENNFISSFSLTKCADAACPSVWFGLTKMGDLDTDPKEEGWTWLDGSTYDKDKYNNWKFEEPSGGVSCARMYVNDQDVVAGEWGDLTCGTSFPYVCKWRATSVSSPMTPTPQPTTAASVSSPMTPTPRPSTTAPLAQPPRENPSTSDDAVKTGLIAGISCLALVLIITVLVVIITKHRHYIESKCMRRTSGRPNRSSAQHSNSALIDDEEYENSLNTKTGPERLPASHTVAIPCTNEDARDGNGNSQAKVKSGTKQKSKKSPEVQQNQPPFKDDLDPKYDNTRPQIFDGQHHVEPSIAIDGTSLYDNVNSQSNDKHGTNQKMNKSQEVQQNHPPFNDDLDPEYDNTQNARPQISDGQHHVEPSIAIDGTSLYDNVNSQSNDKHGTNQKMNKSQEVQQKHPPFNDDLDPEYDNTQNARPQISDGQHGVAPSIAIAGASLYDNVNGQSNDNHVTNQKMNKSQEVQPNQPPFNDDLNHNYGNTRSGEGMSRSQPNLTLGHDLTSVEHQKMHRTQTQLAAALRKRFDNHGDASTRLDVKMGREAKNHVTLPANSAPADSESSETGIDNIPERYKGSNLDGEPQSWSRNKRPVFAQLSYSPTTSDNEGTEHYVNAPEKPIYDQDHYRHLDATNRQAEKYEKVEARIEAVTLDHNYVDVIA